MLDKGEIATINVCPDWTRQIPYMISYLYLHNTAAHHSFILFRHLIATLAQS